MGSFLHGPPARYSGEGLSHMWLLGALCLAFCAAQLRSGPGWELYCVGNCTTDASPKDGRGGGVVLMGGGTDVEAALIWLVQRGTVAGPPDIVILRAGPPGDDAYDSFIFGLARCRSVSTLIVHNASARGHDVLDVLTRADALFFAGGDQSVYYTLWRRDGIQHVLNGAIDARTRFAEDTGGLSGRHGVVLG